MKLNTLVYCVIFGFITNLWFTPALSRISDQCIGCLCYASTGCNRETGCNEGGVCGPLLITWAYWADGGKYVIKGTNPSDPNAYPQCTKDLYCASETVRNYMGKYEKDCNGDGIIDCDDYARIHKSGSGACSDPNILETKYYKEFRRCQAQVHS